MQNQKAKQTELSTYSAMMLVSLLASTASGVASDMIVMSGPAIAVETNERNGEWNVRQINIQQISSQM